MSAWACGRSVLICSSLVSYRESKIRDPNLRLILQDLEKEKDPRKLCVNLRNGNKLKKTWLTGPAIFFFIQSYEHFSIPLVVVVRIGKETIMVVCDHYESRRGCWKLPGFVGIVIGQVIGQVWSLTLQIQLRPKPFCRA